MKDSSQKYEGDTELEYSQVMKDANLMVNALSSADLRERVAESVLNKRHIQAQRQLNESIKEYFKNALKKFMGKYSKDQFIHDIKIIFMEVDKKKHYAEIAKCPYQGSAASTEFLEKTGLLELFRLSLDRRIVEQLNEELSKVTGAAMEDIEKKVEPKIDKKPII